MTDLDLEALRALADTATPGPWEVGDSGSLERPCWEVGNDAFSNPSSDLNDGPAFNAIIDCGIKADADFIAASRTAVPALIEENESLRATIQEMRAEMDALRASHKANVGRLQAEVDEWIEESRDSRELYEIWRRKGNELGAVARTLTAERDALRRIALQVFTHALDSDTYDRDVPYRGDYEPGEGATSVCIDGWIALSDEQDALIVDALASLTEEEKP